MNTKDFIQNFTEVLELDIPSSITPETAFRSLEEWDSLSYLSVIAMIKDEYGIEIGGSVFKKFNTIGDIIRFIESK